MTLNSNENKQLEGGQRPHSHFKVNYKKLIVQLITLFFMIGLPLITLVVSEIIVREVLNLSFREWASGFTKRFALSFAIIIALINVLYILPRRWFLVTSFMLSGLLVVFAIANRVKLEVLNSPISIGDFALLNELQGLDNPAGLSIPLMIGIGIVVIAVIVAIFWLIPKVKENWVIKIGVFLLSCAFLAILWTDNPVSLMKKAQMESTWWRLDVALARNGLFGNFILLAKQNEIEPPASYSKNTIENIGNKYQPTAGTSEEKPNVIFIMSEAFVDPYHFGEEHFAKDPIPNFHRLFKESMHGKMYTPEFGGGTANVEFEALTGLSRQFLPASYVAYQLYVKKPLPSVAYSFKEVGYDTTAIHSFYGWYYQRQSVYRLLGFNQFISGEFMDLDYEIGSEHGFPKDKHITDSVLEALDKSEERDFIHAVGTEGHTPYEPLADSEFLKTGTLPDTTRQYLNSFTEKMNSVDAELGRLVENLEKRDEPSILVFFGDHYPSFANNNQVYGSEGTKIANDMRGDYEDFLATHEVPYFIWRSEGNEPRELDLTPNQFGAITLEMAGVQGNTVTAILDKMRALGDTVIPYNQWQKQMGSQTEEMKELHLLQYDLLHGKRYSEEIPGLIKKPPEDYHLGLYSSMEINKVTDAADQYEILVKGAPKFSMLMSEDDKEIKTEWKHIENGIASFTVSKKDIDIQKSYRFSVYDSLDNVLRSTKEFEFKNAE